jgi:hypothetical protein
MAIWIGPCRKGTFYPERDIPREPTVTLCMMDPGDRDCIISAQRPLSSRLALVTR